MADKKISQLDRLEKIDGTELIPVAKDGANYSITPAQITHDVEEAQAQDLAKITELQGKLNGIDNVSEELAKFATKTELTQGLQTKLDRTEFTERMQTVSEQLGLKADATSVADILKLIPTQASESNKLADKDFVNSSIATNTAEFKGTYNSLGELQKVTADANDYGFVISTDSDGNTVYSRYKFTENVWKFEYALNNSSFTAAQFAALNSGATKELIDKLSSLPNASDILTGKHAAAKYYPLTDGQDLEHLVETLNEGLGQVEEDMKLFATKSELGTYLTKTEAGNTYVKKSGDTMTGDLKITRSNSAVGSLVGITMSPAVDLEDKYAGIYAISEAEYANSTGLSFYTGYINEGRQEKMVLHYNGNLEIKTKKDVAPLSVTSTTKVANLNADMVDGLHGSDLMHYNNSDKDYSSNASNIDVLKGEYDKLCDSYPHAVKLRRGSHSMAFGWFLDTPLHSTADTALGGWFISNYYIPKWVGAENGNWEEHTFAFLDSTVAAANKLATTRTLWGQSFDGTNDVKGNIEGVPRIIDTHNRAILTTDSNSVVLGSMDNDDDTVVSGHLVIRGKNVTIQGNTGRYDLHILNTNGNVGIGTNNPTSKLDVKGKVTVLGSYNRTIEIDGPSLKANVPTGLWDFGYDIKGSDGSSLGSAFGIYGNESTIYWYHYGGVSHLDAAMYILSDSKVGIGTSTPTEKLDVNGNIKTSGHLISTTTTTTDISKVPTTSQICVVNTSQSGTFGLASSMTAGTELQVFVNNTGSIDITITIPDTFKHNGTTSIDIPAGNYGEINVISDGTNLYLRAI